MTNKKLGNDFEQEVCEILSKHGFWVHPLNANKSGQPADIIAVRNKTAYLIDAKVCSSRGFALSRVEENQELAMDLWWECGNGVGWFAFRLKGGIWMLDADTVREFAKDRSSISYGGICAVAIPFERWVRQCE